MVGGPGDILPPNLVLLCSPFFVGERKDKTFKKISRQMVWPRGIIDFFPFVLFSLLQHHCAPLPFLPAAKPSGPRTVRVVVVVVVVVGGEQFDDQLLDLLLSCSPTLNFLRGGIQGSLTRFLFGVGSRAL